MAGGCPADYFNQAIKGNLMDKEMKISARSRKRLEEQGLRGYADSELARHRFGHRFAYFICMSLVVIGLAFKSQPFLLIANAVALLGILPPYHPVDYLYNYSIRHLIGRPKLPPRANQGRFACSIATVLLGIVNYNFYQGSHAVAYGFGAVLLASAFLVTFLDLCIPSRIYNALFERGAGRLRNDDRAAEEKPGN
jgi:hypothetical protein